MEIMSKKLIEETKKEKIHKVRKKEKVYKEKRKCLHIKK